MTHQQTEIPQPQSAIEMYNEQIEKGAKERSDCRRAGKGCDECLAERIECIYYIQYMWFKFGAEYALQLRQEEIDEIVYTLRGLLHMHNCEQEGIGSGKPTATMWYIAVTEAEKVLLKYEKR